MGMGVNIRITIMVDSDHLQCIMTRKLLGIVKSVSYIDSDFSRTYSSIIGSIFSHARLGTNSRQNVNSEDNMQVHHLKKRC